MVKKSFVNIDCGLITIDGDKFVCGVRTLECLSVRGKDFNASAAHQYGADTGPA